MWRQRTPVTQTRVKRKEIPSGESTGQPVPAADSRDVPNIEVAWSSPPSGTLEAPHRAQKSDGHILSNYSERRFSERPSRALRVKSILLDVTHAEPQARAHLRGDSMEQLPLPPRRASAISTLNSGQASFDARGQKLESFAVDMCVASRGRGQASPSTSWQPALGAGEMEDKWRGKG